MNMSNQTKPKLNYWLCRLCIIIFCLIFTGLTASAKGGEETGKATAQERVVTGTVVGASTGESLPGVNIVPPEVINGILLPTSSGLFPNPNALPVKSGISTSYQP